MESHKLKRDKHTIATRTRMMLKEENKQSVDYGMYYSVECNVGIGGSPPGGDITSTKARTTNDNYENLIGTNRFTSNTRQY